MTLTITTVIALLLFALAIRQRRNLTQKHHPQKSLVATTSPPLALKISDTFTIPTLIFKSSNENLIFLGATLNLSHPSYLKILSAIGTNQIHNAIIESINKNPTFDPKSEQNLKHLCEETKKSINQYLADHSKTNITYQAPITSITLRACRVEKYQAPL